MKRTIVILALVTAFVFAFGTVAQAQWRGFTPIRTQAELDAGMLHNFLTFNEARYEMDRNDAPAALQGTAHGGYVTTTTKCATCHSAHTAPAVWDGARVNDGSGRSQNANRVNQFFLTAGADGCESCHVAGGTQSSRLLVEWGPDGGGPHAAPRRGCALCHNSGIHGLGSSEFNVMNTFLLGNTRARNLPGSGSLNPNVNRDQQIRAELGTTAENARLQRAGMLDVPAASPSFTAGTPDPINTWWYNGAPGLGAIGQTPPAIGDSGAAREAYGAARSLATAFTCGESGCHMNSAMFNLNWGMGFERRAQVANVAGPTHATLDEGERTGTSASTIGGATVTGHVMPSMRGTGVNNAGAGNACGPCHGGNPAGFPTASSTRNAADTAYIADVSRRAFGCDQCHDMVGVATNSTAWPHGNRGILVYEWEADGSQVQSMMAAGNLWMYAGNIARAAGAPNTTGNPGSASQAFRGETSVNPFFADQSWTVMTGVASGRYGIPNNDGATYFEHPDYSAYAPPGSTGLIDGSCLKCHVPLDAASFANTPVPSIGADAIRHTWSQGGPANPTWNGVIPSGSQRLFLYR